MYREGFSQDVGARFDIGELEVTFERVARGEVSQFERRVVANGSAKAIRGRLAVAGLRRYAILLVEKVCAAGVRGRKPQTVGFREPTECAPFDSGLGSRRQFW